MRGFVSILMNSSTNLAPPWDYWFFWEKKRKKNSPHGLCRACSAVHKYFWNPSVMALRIGRVENCRNRVRPRGILRYILDTSVPPYFCIGVGKAAWVETLYHRASLIYLGHQPVKICTLSFSQEWWSPSCDKWSTAKTPLIAGYSSNYCGVREL